MTSAIPPPSSPAPYRGRHSRGPPAVPGVPLVSAATSPWAPMFSSAFSWSFSCCRMCTSRFRLMISDSRGSCRGGGGQGSREPGVNGTLGAGVKWQVFAANDPDLEPTCDYYHTYSEGSVNVDLVLQHCFRDIDFAITTLAFSWH